MLTRLKCCGGATLVAILGTICWNGAVAAQEAAEPSPRDAGLYVAIGVGVGAFSYGGNPADDLEQEPGGTVLLPRLGYRLNARTSLGVELGAWAGRTPLGLDAGYANARVFVETAPRWGKGLRFGAAAGVGSMRVDLQPEGRYRDRGPDLAVEVAYDWTVASMLAVTPYLAASRGWLGEDSAHVLHGGGRLTFW